MRTNNQKNIQLIKDNKIDELINANKLFCQKMVNEWTRDEYIGQELMQEARIALYEAAMKYDHSTETNFLAYAKFYIKKRIYEYLYNFKPTIRIPLNHIKNIKKFNTKKQDEFYNLDDDNEFSETEKEVINNQFTVISGDLLNEDNTSTIMATIAGDVDSQIVEMDNQQIIKDKIKSLLMHLKPQDREFIKLYYGIDNEERDEKTMAELLGVTRQAVSIRKIRILKLLQKVSLS